jgi:hypothetical protein
VVHGSIFGYERDKSLTGKDYFQKQANGEKPPFSREQFGGSIGGPIIRNRMFYFGAIEQMRKDTGTFVPANRYDRARIARRRDAAWPGSRRVGVRQTSADRSAAGSAPDLLAEIESATQ